MQFKEYQNREKQCTNLGAVQVCHLNNLTLVQYQANQGNPLKSYNRVFHRFWQAKFAYGGSILGTSQFSLLPQLPQKMTLI